MRLLHTRVPLLRLNNPENVFNLELAPIALLVDLEGTLTTFCPSLHSVVEAIVNFDKVASQYGLEERRVHYVTNTNFVKVDNNWPSPVISDRLHCRAHKPFFSPPQEFCRLGHGTVVIGDQYLTDGLLAWRFGFSFGL